MPHAWRTPLVPLSVISLLLPMAAQAGTILSVTGMPVGGTGADPLSVMWQSTADYTGVEIAALLGYGGNQESDGTAHLRGPVTAETALALPNGFAGWLTLFTGMGLPAGTYTLTIGSPDAPASYLNWLENFTPSIVSDPQTQLLGYNRGPYRPGLPGYLFQVSGTRETPEPNSLVLLTGGVLAWLFSPAGIRRARRAPPRARRPGIPRRTRSAR